MFAGAAAEMGEAVIVNPYDVDELAEGIQRAVMMPLDERIDRWRQLFEKVQSEDIEAWYTTFLDALRATRRQETASVPEV